MSDALLSSPQIPLGVNVVRLAGTSDEEGITALSRSISVRYTGSSISSDSRQPMALYRTMSFEVTLAAQSYLNNGGHDYVTQMCIGSYNTLTNQVPAGTGSNIFEPFRLTQEDFQGISNSTHYVYVQTWQLVVQEIRPMIALDPCVAMGNCRHLFPESTINELLPADIVVGTAIFSPVLPPDGDDVYDPELCGVVARGDDLYYKYDEEEIFLEDWRKYSLVSTKTFDTSGELLIVNIYDEDGNFFRRDFFSNGDERRIIQVAGQFPAQDALDIPGSGRSSIDQLGNPQNTDSEALPPVVASKNGIGSVKALRATVYADPTNPDAPVATVKFGAVYNVKLGAELTYRETEFIYIGGTSIGKAWIRKIDFQVFSQEEVEPRIDCGPPDLGEGSADQCCSSD